MPATVFPGLGTELLFQRFSTLETLTMIDDGTVDGRPAVFSRPLRPSDPAASLGIFEVDWQPDDSEFGAVFPTLSTYVWGLQVLVRHGDEQEGRALHSAITKSVRTMLDRDPDTRVALGQLNESPVGGGVERAQRWGVRTQRFANNEIDGQFVFLSTTDFWLQTESL